MFADNRSQAAGRLELARQTAHSSEVGGGQTPTTLNVKNRAVPKETTGARPRFKRRMQFFDGGSGCGCVCGWDVTSRRCIPRRARKHNVALRATTSSGLSDDPGHTAAAIRGSLAGQAVIVQY